MQAPIRGLTESSGEVFLLDILSHRMSVIAMVVRRDQPMKRQDENQPFLSRKR